MHVILWFPRDELPVQTILLTFKGCESKHIHVPTQFLHDLTLHFLSLFFFSTMYVLLRFIVSSFHSLVRLFHSFSVKLDVKRAFFGLWLKERVIHTSGAFDSWKVLTILRNDLTMERSDRIPKKCCKDQDPQNVPTCQLVVGVHYFRGTIAQ